METVKPERTRVKCKDEKKKGKKGNESRNKEPT